MRVDTQGNIIKAQKRASARIRKYPQRKEFIKREEREYIAEQREERERLRQSGAAERFSEPPAIREREPIPEVEQVVNPFRQREPIQPQPSREVEEKKD